MSMSDHEKYLAAYRTKQSSTKRPRLLKLITTLIEETTKSKSPSICPLSLIMISEALVPGSKLRRCFLINLMRTWTWNSERDDFIWRSFWADLCHFVLKPTHYRGLITSQVVFGIYTIEDIDLYVAGIYSGRPHTAVRFTCLIISIGRGSLLDLAD
jgi:hypothetical protein